MPLNYLMIPENIQRRPLPGHRHRPKKVKKVVETSETFSPYSRAGRRVPGEVKVETTMVKSAKVTEERGDLALFKHIKKLDKILAARRLSATPHSEGVEVEMEVETVQDVIATKEEDVSESVTPQCSQKRPFTESAETSIDVVGMRVVKRARSNAVASSSRVRIEDVPHPSSIIYSTVRSASVLSQVPQKRPFTESAETSSIDVDVRVVKRARFHAMASSSRIEDAPQPPSITHSITRSRGVVSQLPQKRPLTGSAETSNTDDVDVRVVKRARFNAVASSSRVRIEDTLQSPSIANSTEASLDLAGNAGSTCSYDSGYQELAQFHRHDLVNATNAVEQFPWVLAHAAHHDVALAFPDFSAAHQINNHPDFSVHEAPNSSALFHLHNDFDAHSTDDSGLDLEHVAVACAWAAIGDLTQIGPEEIPTFNPIDGCVDLNLEHLAAACAYAGMDEPFDTMDTLLDSTCETVELDSAHVAVSCAWAAIGDLTDTRPEEFPTFNPIDGCVDLNLEHLAAACAYAGLDGPIDTTDTLLDDTRGNVELDSEHVAVSCAWAAIGDLTDIESDKFPTFNSIDPIDGCGLNLERLAVACSYAGMDEHIDNTDTLLDDNVELDSEHVAVSCAWAAIGDLTDIGPEEFPTSNSIDGCVDWECLAAACSYAGLDELIDTTDALLGDTRGTVFDFVPRELPVFDQLGFVQSPHPQDAPFEHGTMFQLLQSPQHIPLQREYDMNFPQMYQFGRHQVYEYFVDGDQRFRPPTDEYRVVHFGNKRPLVNAEDREPDPAELLAFEALFGAEGWR